jgi:hypothetical protein
MKSSWIFACLVFEMACGALPMAIGQTLEPSQEPSASRDILEPEEPVMESPQSDPLANWNVSLPTLGGAQFWTDHRWWNGWRLQYNSTLDHWRVIDPRSIRRGWGTKPAMLVLWDQIRSDTTTPSPSQPDSDAPAAVLLLHGLMRTSGSMKPLAHSIRSHRLASQKKLQGDAASDADIEPTVIAFTYASTRDPLTAHADAFRELVEHLPGNPRWQAVGHSMGNIVLRMAISQWQTQGDPHGALKRLDRVVMLGPPNQGSSFAKKISQLGLFETVTGRSGLALGPQWEEFQSQLGTPPCPFAVIAGNIAWLPIQNPWLDGPSDGVVTVAEAQLDGMDEFATAPVLHSFLMQDKRCMAATIDYLSGGSIASSLEPLKPEPQGTLETQSPKD